MLTKKNTGFYERLTVLRQVLKQTQQRRWTYVDLGSTNTDFLGGRKYLKPKIWRPQTHCLWYILAEGQLSLSYLPIMIHDLCGNCRLRARAHSSGAALSVESEIKRIEIFTHERQEKRSS